MLFEKTNLEGVFIIEPNLNSDDRGWFMRTFSKDIFIDNIKDFNSTWVQMNHSFSKEQYTWRGFHFQNPPFKETKLLRCISGEIIDYVIDLRLGSKTFLNFKSIILSEANKKMIYIPKGFAHGFLTLKPNTELIYLHDEYYNPESEAGIKYNDPILNFSLPFKPEFISKRDLSHNLLNNKFKGI